MRSGRWLDLSVPFVGFRHLGDGTYRHLRGEAELLSGLVIHELLQLDRIGHAMHKRHVGNRIASGIERRQRAQERGMVFGRWRQFDEQRLFHAQCVAVWSIFVNSYKGRSPRG